MTILEQIAQEKFRHRVAVYLREHLPEHTAVFSDSELDNKITGWQQRAAAYEVTTERGIAKWSFLALVTGDKFDKTPAIQEYLRQPAPEPSVKMDTLMDVLEIRLRSSEFQKR